MAKKKKPQPDTEFEEKKAQLADIEEDVILFDGYEDALIGYGYTFQNEGHLIVAIYDYDKCLECLAKQGMNKEDAIEWFEVNTLGCYAGPGNPVFMKKFTKTSQG